MDHTIRYEYNVADGTVRCKYSITDRDTKWKCNDGNKGGKHSNVKCKYAKVYCDDPNFGSVDGKEIAYIEDDGFV